MATAPSRPKKIVAHQPTITPQQERKFYVLVGLAGLVIVLLWVATLPLNFRTDGSARTGPQALFGAIGTALGHAGNALHVITQATKSLTHSN